MLERPRPPLPGRVPFDQQVTVHQLRLLRAVAQHGGVSPAAAALGLSQPAVSHQLKQLASSVGIPLLEPAGRGVRLTRGGLLLDEHARRILGEFDAAGAAIDDLMGVRAGVLRVAGDTTVGIYVLPDVLGAFRAAHPGTEVRLAVDNRDRALARLLASEVDFAVIGRRPDRSPVPLLERPFLANELVAIAAPAHPLVDGRPVELARLAAEPFIIREPGSGTRETVEEAFRAAGLELRPVMELASNGAIKRAVARQLGVSILSRYAIGLEVAVGHLVELPVVGLPLRRTWHLVYPRDRHLDPLDAAFVEFVAGGSIAELLGRPLTTD